VHLTDDAVSELARQLFNARMGLREGDLPLPPTLTEAEGYRVQLAVLDRHLEAGDTLAGYKIGLTSADARASYRTTKPAWGFLLASAVSSTSENPRLPHERARRIEAEFAFVLERDLPRRPLSVAEVVAHTRAVHLAAEIVDTRWARDGGLGALLADDVSNAAVALGPEVEVRAALSTAIPAVVRARDRESRGISTAVWGEPAAALGWLAGALGRHQRELTAGQIVMSGSFGAPFPIEPSDDVHIEFGHLGHVHLKGTTR
jgi:2-keto-4-pentenoate hydratase